MTTDSTFWNSTGKLHPRIGFFHMLRRVAEDCFEKGHRRMSVPGVQGNA
jgi:hypothetical protein